MCTVTYIPVGEKKYITSNRDEKAFRKKALPPQPYLHKEISLIYPKDGDAGGSWIALNENGKQAHGRPAIALRRLSFFCCGLSSQKYRCLA